MQNNLNEIEVYIRNHKNDSSKYNLCFVYLPFSVAIVDISSAMFIFDRMMFSMSISLQYYQHAEMKCARITSYNYRFIYFLIIICDHSADVQISNNNSRICTKSKHLRHKTFKTVLLKETLN